MGTIGMKEAVGDLAPAPILTVVSILNLPPALLARFESLPPPEKWATQASPPLSGEAYACVKTPEPTM